MRLTHLDLCTGIGGFHLAAEWAGFDTVGFSEIESYCCKLLTKKWPNIKNYGDIRTADFSGLRGGITVLSAGVPCQPASCAGKRRGSRDDRWLWPATLDVVGSVEPAWAIFENPDGILSMGEFDGVLLRLADLGYAVRLFSVPANSVGAKHRRQRVFIIANAKLHGSYATSERGGIGESQEEGWLLKPEGYPAVAHAGSERQREGLYGWRTETGTGTSVELNRAGGNAETVADADSSRGQSDSRVVVGETSLLEAEGDRSSDASLRSGQALADTAQRSFGLGIARHNLPWRLTQPPLLRRVDGVPHRSHRLKALGNAVVPQQAYPFFAAIAKTEEHASR